MSKIVFECPKCRAEIVCGSETDLQFIACPKCGTMVKVPERSAQPRAKALRMIVRVVLFVLLCWALTLVFGARQIDPEVQSVASNTRRSFPDAVIRVGAPLPFVIAYRVDASGTKKGVKTNISFAKYYLWYVVSAAEIPVGDRAPAVLTWVWF
jgi:hypothetical protein